ncbi:MAG TPA: antibiotic biosynthesis monooxygenase [Usitatibacter sp.]|nr:antibiotic biosynthesis monooxygenase [Usitatibacter sp.]
MAGRIDKDGVGMVVVIFEVWPASGRAPEYLDLAAKLKPELEKMDGFVSIERFESLTTKGKILSLSTWRDEEAVRAWRNREAHRAAQAKGRHGVFADYRIRVAAVLRDYGMKERAEVPADSRAVHE